MKTDIDFLELTRTLWPVLMSFVGAIAWIFYQLNKKNFKIDM